MGSGTLGAEGAVGAGTLGAEGAVGAGTIVAEGAVTTGAEGTVGARSIGAVGAVGAGANRAGIILVRDAAEQMLRPVGHRPPQLATPVKRYHPLRSVRSSCTIHLNSKFPSLHESAGVRDGERERG